MRAAAIVQLGQGEEGRTALDELLKLVPDFAHSGRSLLSRYVKADGLMEKLMEGLRKAGLDLNAPTGVDPPRPLNCEPFSSQDFLFG